MRSGSLASLRFLSALVFGFACFNLAPAQSSQREDRGELAIDDRNDNREARFRWEGTVDGTTLVRISRRRVDYEYTSGLPVQRQRYDFTNPLPDARVEVRLNVLAGRGEVRLLQQPRPQNGYVAVVRIEDRERGAGDYAFELFWERPRNGGGGNRPRDDESFEWRGRVDGESIVRVRGDAVWVDNLSGRDVTNVSSRFSRPLPQQPRELSLVDTSGRGEIVLIEQPDRGNDYTASVKIRDPQGGAGNYAFALVWRGRGNDQNYPPSRPYPGRPSDPDQPTGRGLRWSGRVDGNDVLRISGSDLTVDHRSGVPVIGMDYRFDKPLPYAPRQVTVNKIRGRGRVTVIEQPSRSNNFTALILIEDRDGGSANYELEVIW